ncbi:class I SAM-dependent methyltransferase [Alsobacter sp. SYSU BS001988]
MTPLGRRLAAEIAAAGPISVARYMAACLGDPLHGYYATRDPFGPQGDFVTAPEISQMFGELIGLWCAEAWMRLGSPPVLRLVELGPGRGTLMADALRAARALPPFRAALDVRLVETSPTLRARQEAALAGAGVPVAWASDVDEVPAGPALVIANEFLDALPIRQFVKAQDGWRERLVGLAEGDPAALRFGLAPEPEPMLADAPGEPGAVLEVGEAGLDIARRLAERFAATGGAALAIDYGHVRPGFGDTLQAVHGHAYADPLAEPGEADLTAHVDFAALGRVARTAGAVVHGPVTQGAFLRGLGLAERAAALKRGAAPPVAAAVDTAAARLADGGDGMGELFKVLAFGSAGMGALPGFGLPGIDTGGPHP